MKPFEQQTYYEILEIPVTAPEAEIRAAYERAIEMYSPDSIAVYTLVDPGQIDALRARLTEAMEILTEPDLRVEYDRMIGVSRADANTVASMASSLVEAASAAQPQAPVAAAPEPASPSSVPAAPAPEEASAPSETPAVPAPAAVAAPEVASEPEEQPVAAAPVAAPEPEEQAAPAPAVAPPASVSTQEPQAAPAPEASPVAAAPAPSTAEEAAESPAAVPAAAAVSPSPEQIVVPGALTPRQIHAAFRSYTLSYVPILVPSTSVPQAPSTAAAAEAATSPVPAAPVEPAPGPSAPATGVTAEPPQQPAPVLVHHEEDELSGVRAPMPSPTETRPTPSRSAPGRYSRVSTTPPPLPPGARRAPHAAPTPPPGRPAVEPAKGSARPGQGAGMDLEEAQQIAQEAAIATAEAALAQVAAKAREQPRPKPVELPPNAEFNGEVLRQVRESRGMSLHQLAERTRISSKHLENVEADRYAALPATVYLRGILMNIARELGLDPLRVSRSYLTLASEQQKKK